jgi:hypothetical protein
MIVTKLVGGLGNQMFQYAVGRALALRRGAELRIDRRSFAEYKLHAYGLDCFRAEVQDAPPEALPALGGEGFVRRSIRRLGLGTRLRTYHEPDFAFHPEVLALPDDTYLEGYWQSERYFADVADAIRADFQVARPPSAENAQWLQMVASTPSVSLHVRRGDYVSNATSSLVHGACSIDYYGRAIAWYRERLGEPVFFVFSDDPAWVREHLPFGASRHHFVANNDASTNYEDLRLMAACRHHIIANSTFSWWGAWLNPSPDKQVVAPLRWFRTDAIPEQDVVPAVWVRL